MRREMIQSLHRSQLCISRGRRRRCPGCRCRDREVREIECLVAVRSRSPLPSFFCSAPLFSPVSKHLPSYSSRRRRSTASPTSCTSRPSSNARRAAAPPLPLPPMRAEDAPSSAGDSPRAEPEAEHNFTMSRSSESTATSVKREGSDEAEELDQLDEESQAPAAESDTRPASPAPAVEALVALPTTGVKTQNAQFVHKLFA